MLQLKTETSQISGYRQQAHKSDATYPETCISSGLSTGFRHSWIKLSQRGTEGSAHVLLPSSAFLCAQARPPAVTAGSIRRTASPGGKRVLSPTKIPEVTHLENLSCIPIPEPGTGKEEMEAY